MSGLNRSCSSGSLLTLSEKALRVTVCPPTLQLEESNRTLTVDVGNLAGEKEELNNQLKDMQQRECR